jgi:site-specific DNA recombinase
MSRSKVSAPQALIPAVIYARQSETKDGSESLSDQARELRRSAERLGLVVVAELVEPESTSGYKRRGLERPRWRDLLGMIRTRQAGAVLVLTTDRLSRGGGPGYLPFYEAVEAAGLDPDRVVATPNGWVSEWELGIRAAMDREEAKKIATRMKLVRQREAEAGKPRGGGKRPYGFETDLVTVRESEAARIREAAQRVLNGETCWGVAKSWNDDGVPNGSGNLWNAVTLKRILTSGRVAGLREHRGEIVGQAVWPAIVDRDTWEQVRTLVETNISRRPSAGGGRPRTFPLNGFLFCGRCGSRLVTRRREGGRREYCCQTRESGGTRQATCGALVIHADAVEVDVLEVVVGTILDPERIDQLLSAAPASESGGTDIAGSIAELTRKKEKLVDLYMDDKIDKSIYERRLSTIVAEIDALEAERASRAGRPVLATLPRTEDALRGEWASRGIEWQRLVVDAIVERIDVVPAGRKRPPVRDRLRYTLR